MGTAVGVLVGIVLVSLGGHNILLLGAGTTLTVLLCAVLGVYESFRIATVTFALVALLGGTEPWSFGLHRFLDVAFGLLVALGVTVGLWPPRVRRDLRHTLAALLEADARLYQRLVENYLSASNDSGSVLEARGAIKASLATARTLVGDIGREPPAAEDRMRR